MKKVILLIALVLPFTACAVSRSEEIAEKNARCSHILGLANGSEEWQRGHLKEAYKKLDVEQIAFQFGYAEGIVSMLSKMNKEPKQKSAVSLYLATCAKETFWKFNEVEEK